MAAFSGYVAADELYDGPFCILSVVDNRRYKRILYEVLDHQPTHDDIRTLLRRLKASLQARNLALLGVTTDGSALYPEPLREVFGKVRHQICQFHVIKDIVKAVVGAVASARKGLAAQQPKLPKGRPSTPAAKAAARTKKRLAAQGGALFTHRYLFVQRRGKEFLQGRTHLGEPLEPTPQCGQLVQGCLGPTAPIEQRVHLFHDRPQRT